MKNSGDGTMVGTKDASVLSGAHVVDPSQGIDVGAGAVHSITLVTGVAMVRALASKDVGEPISSKRKTR
jgi:hypothetical protein